jgi:adenylate kinase family enzyme
MKKVAIFGNTGGGKSTLARRLAELTRLPLYPLDLIQYRPGGGEVPRQDYLRAHADLLDKDEWIIDGFGCVASAWARGNTSIDGGFHARTQDIVWDRVPGASDDPIDVHRVSDDILAI